MLEDHIFCPSCGTNTQYAIIKFGRENLVRCEGCGMIQSVQKERERLVNMKVIVNKNDLSQLYVINIPEREELRVGNELLIDDEVSDVVLTKITSLETDRRVEKGFANTVKTVWARAIDRVQLKVSVYENGRTRSIKLSLPGDEVFEVGDIREFDEIKFKVVKIKLRGEGFAMNAEAKDIVRVWSRAV